MCRELAGLGPARPWFGGGVGPGMCSTGGTTSTLGCLACMRVLFTAVQGWKGRQDRGKAGAGWGKVGGRGTKDQGKPCACHWLAACVLAPAWGGEESRNDNAAGKVVSTRVGGQQGWPLSGRHRLRRPLNTVYRDFTAYNQMQSQRGTTADVGCRPGAGWRRQPEPAAQRAVRCRQPLLTPHARLTIRLCRK